MTQGVRGAAQAAKDVVVFKALANPVRLQIVSLVAAAPEGQVSAGEIVDRFSLSQPTISHHLRVLREAGVLTTYKTSTFVYYRFAPQLRETVAAVLPGSAAAEPPAVTNPVRRAPSGTARSTSKRSSRTTASAAQSRAATTVAASTPAAATTSTPAAATTSTARSERTPVAEPKAGKKPVKSDDAKPKKKDKKDKKTKKSKKK
ncbi:ArsR/SmtB family transcription factor [Cumulibacter manganitolerans]|uniref:ArsR/SmtB family transcription factor n=1 Tax=Cumulibacter manganitolerans TaxID=1884992 RepID=UPI00188636B7|nr:metalloregulator ArsR/SmtB family transcription factor [Cumulibacter manganitolerans]